MAAADRRRRPAPGVRRARAPAARRSLGHRDVALVASLLPRTAAGYVPDLLTPQPPPSTPARALTDQLDLVAASDDEQVARQVGFCVDFGRALPADTLGAVASGSFARRAANGLRTFWKDTLADGWGALRDVLDADIAARSEVLGRRGVGDVLGSLHRDLEWDGRRITVHKPYAEQRTIAGVGPGARADGPRLAGPDRAGVQPRGRGVLLPRGRDRRTPAAPRDRRSTS